MKVCYCFNNPFTDDWNIPDMNLPPITIDDITYPKKRSCYTSDLLLSAISIASENYVSNLNTPSDLPRLFLLPFENPYHLHAIKIDETYCSRAKIGYCCREKNEKDATKRQDSIAPRALIYVNILLLSCISLINSEPRTCLMEHKYCT